MEPSLFLKGQPLPAQRTIRKKVEHISFEGGLLDDVFELMKEKAEVMCSKEKKCSLHIDQMSLKESVDWDSKTKSLIGNVTVPEHSGKANKALVFLIAGTTTRWKQTCAYYFTGSEFDGKVMGPIIKDILCRLHDIGLDCKSITTDMGPENLAMWK